MAGRLLIAGCGRLGNLLADEWLSRDGQVWGIRRSVQKLAPGVAPIAWAMVDEAPPSLPKVDWLVFAASPAERSPEAYRKTYIDGPAAVIDALPNPPTGVIFVSSTAVYGQDQGEILDETAATEPQRFNGKLLLEAEQALEGRVDQVIIARCSGLYGPGPGRVVQKLRSGQLNMTAEHAVFGNRIHRRDAARALEWITRQDKPEPIYLLTDPNPTPRHAVYQWLAEFMNRPVAGSEPGPDDGVVCGKRLQPKRLLAAGFEFLYPDYKAGFKAILSSSSPAS